MKSKVLAAGLMAALMTLTACNEEEGNPYAKARTYDVGAIVDAKDMSPAEKAEALALIGEKLVTPVSFMFADEVLTQAIKFDAGNPRAQLYKYIVAPAMVLKGSLRGIRPLANKLTQYSQDKFTEMDTKLSASRSLYLFLVDGPADINNEEKLQQLLDKVYGQQDKLRLFARGFKRNVLKVAPVIINGPEREVLAQCQVAPVGKRDGYHQKYEVSACPWSKVYETTIDSGDIEVMQHAFAGAEIATILATSYDATGGVLYERYISNRNVTTEQGVRFINELPSAGKLRASSSIRMIHGMGTDAYAGARWAQQYQDRLCPKGHYQDNRPGRLFSRGLCVQDLPDPNAPKAETFLRAVSAALSGASTEMGVADEQISVVELSNKTSWDYRTKANVFAPLNNPVADLKTLLPNQFDRCGQPLNVGDSTLGGLFPNGDANDVGARLGKFGKNCYR